MTLTITGFWRL